MSDGIFADIADALEDLILNGTAYTGPTGPLYAQMHTGTPGAAGTHNVSSQTARAPIGTMSGSGGVWTNVAEIGDDDWTSHPANEIILHVSLWTSQTPGDGDFVATGTVPSASIVEGAPVVIAIGGLVTTFPVATN